MSLADRHLDPLPADADRAVLVGRVWDPAADGPSVVVVRDGEAFDITHRAATVCDLCEAADPAAVAQSSFDRSFGALTDILANTPRGRRDASKPWLLAPIDLQAIKAAGVTFAASML